MDGWVYKWRDKQTADGWMNRPKSGFRSEKTSKVEFKCKYLLFAFFYKVNVDMSPMWAHLCLCLFS
jgi:hypothetical protein